MRADMQVFSFTCIVASSLGYMLCERGLSVMHTKVHFLDPSLNYPHTGPAAETSQGEKL